MFEIKQVLQFHEPSFGANFAKMFFDFVVSSFEESSLVSFSCALGSTVEPPNENPEDLGVSLFALPKENPEGWGVPLFVPPKENPEA